MLNVIREYRDYSVLGHMDLITRYDEKGEYPFEKVKPRDLGWQGNRVQYIIPLVWAEKYNTVYEYIKAVPGAGVSVFLHL